MVFLVFLEALYFRHLLSFYTMLLEPPKWEGQFGRLWPPVPGVLAGAVSPHVSVSRVTCPLLRGQLSGAAQPCEFLSQKGVLLPRVYGTSASPL